MRAETTCQGPGTSSASSVVSLVFGVSLKVDGVNDDDLFSPTISCALCTRKSLEESNRQKARRRIAFSVVLFRLITFDIFKAHQMSVSDLHC